MKHST